jgi:hypothetical protein
MATVTVLLAPGYSATEVAERLRAAGMSVGDVLSIGDVPPKTFVITGTASDSAVPGLADVEGVAAVEPEHSVQLPPPDSPIQ